MYHSEAGAHPARLQTALDHDARRGVPRAVVMIGIVSLLTDISAEMVASVLPVYLFSVLRLSPIQYGLVDGLFNGSTALVRLAAAWWADRMHRHKSLAFAGYLLSALSKAGLFFAGIAGWLSVAVLLLADRLGKGIRTAPRDALIAAHAPPHALAAAFGVHRSLDAVGALLGPLAATALLLLAPGRFDLVFAASLGFAVAGLLVLVRLVPARPAGAASAAADDPAADATGGVATTAGPQASQRAATASAATTVDPIAAPALPSLRPAGALRAAWHTPGFVALCAAVTLLSVFTVSDNLLYLGVQRRAGIDAALLPMLFVATAAVFMLGAVPLGRLADRIGALRVFLLGHLSLLLLYAATASGMLRGVSEAVATALLLGTYYAATDGVIMALLAARLPAHARATGMAVMTSLIALARMAASAVFGWAWTQAGHPQAVGWFAAGLAVSLAVTVAALRRFGETTR